MPNLLISAEQVDEALARGQGGFFLVKPGWYVATIDSSQVSEPVVGDGWTRLDNFRFEIADAVPFDGGDPRKTVIRKNVFIGDLVHLAKAVGVPVENGRAFTVNTGAFNSREVGVRVGVRKRSGYSDTAEIYEYASPADAIAKRGR